MSLLLVNACSSTPESLLQNKTSEVPQAVPFTSMQTRLFAVAGSLSNAWADVDNDGDLDLAVSIKGGAVRLYLNQNGVFRNVGPGMNLPTAGDEIRGLSWGDFDNDGDLDLLAGSNVRPIPSRSYVFRNEGERFTEVAEQIGLATPGRVARQSNWVDYNNDGQLDLYAANRTGLNFLYRNEQGQFTPRPFGTAPIDPRRTVGSCWFDMDGDGDLDLFLTNQNGDSDALWRNDGATFVDVAPALGMDQTLRTLMEGGVGCAIGDYDNDGDFDLYVAAYGRNLLYRNNGDQTFSDVGQALGVTGPRSTVGAGWGDFDNDGDLDLIAVGYERVDGEQVPLVNLYRNDGLRFTNVSADYPEINVGDHGVEWVDYDNDGDLDLSVTDGYGASGGHFLLRNELGEKARGRSIRVLVLDAAGHYTAAGAEVRLLDASGRVLMSRQVSTGGGYNTQSATPVYFAVTSPGPFVLEVTYMGNAGPQKKLVHNVVPGTFVRVLADKP